MRQAGNDSGPPGIRTRSHDNRYRACDTLCHLGGSPAASNDHIDLQVDKLAGKPRRFRVCAIAKAVFDQNVLARRVTPLSQALLEGINVGLGRSVRPQEPDPRDFRRLLRGGSEGHGKQAADSRAKERTPARH